MTKKTYCTGGRHFSETRNEIRYDKINPRTKRVVLVIKGKCSICGRNKSRIYSYK